jgi:hypothetical protein
MWAVDRLEEPHHYDASMGLKAQQGLGDGEPWGFFHIDPTGLVDGWRGGNEEFASHHPDLHADAPKDDGWHFGGLGPGELHADWESNGTYQGDHSLIFDPETGHMIIGSPEQHHADLYAKHEGTGNRYLPAAVFDDMFYPYNQKAHPRWQEVHDFFNNEAKMAGHPPLGRGGADTEDEWKFGHLKDMDRKDRKSSEGWNFGKVSYEIPHVFWHEPDGYFEGSHADIPHEPWEPGHYGKGFVLPSGEMTHWKLTESDSDGAPYHPLSYKNYTSGEFQSAFVISPDGRVQAVWSPGTLPDLSHIDPRLKVQKSRGYDFAEPEDNEFHFGATFTEGNYVIAAAGSKPEEYTVPEKTIPTHEPEPEVEIVPEPESQPEPEDNSQSEKIAALEAQLAALTAVPQRRKLVIHRDENGKMSSIEEV